MGTSVAISVGWLVFFSVVLGMALTLITVASMGVVAIKNIHLAVTKKKTSEEKSEDEQ